MSCRFCNIAPEPEGSVRVLVEAKVASIPNLREERIGQAENNASRAAIPWGLLTSGVER